MTDKYSDLKKAAKAATPGEWERDGRQVCPVADQNAALANCYKEVDARYMALASPATVLALIADLEGYQQGADVEAREADAWRKEIKRLNARVSELHDRKERASQRYARWHSRLIESLREARAELSTALLNLDLQWAMAENSAQEIDQLKAEAELLRAQVDRLLAHCPDGECLTCGEIICPHGGAMHFHHDGCPSCAMHDEEMHQEPQS
jgi:DNA repair exonuclease SbcCD ATPase subunit